MKVINLKCPNCNGILEINYGENVVTCKYCGTKVSIENENATTSDKILNILERKMKETKDYHNSPEYKKEEKKTIIIAWVVIIAAWLILILFIGKSNPSLKDYNSIKLGMTYEECKNILKFDGHLIFEENNITKYVWYNAGCTEENCDIIIELTFENDKLVNRKENNLK